ncbi:MAG TPA: glycosyltransferase [Solirubrobacteraceae bacterium]|nr:glycosyltransferase [Solirubrobacteraceae bacterium]
MSVADAAPELSAIVCTHNGAGTLATALESLARQTLPATRYEVIVVDDGSTDDTAGVAAAAGARVITLRPNAGLAAARNAGVSAARGAIVAFTDDDCEADPGWATTLLQAFADPAVDGAGGRVVPDSPNPFVRRFLTAHNPLVPLGDDLLESSAAGHRLLLYVRRTVLGKVEPRDRLYAVVGANMAFRRELVYELGGFDEEFRFGAEEEDLCLRAHARPGGARIAYVPTAEVRHWFHDRVGDSVRRARAYGRGNARRALKHPQTKLIVYPAPVAVAALVSAAALTRRTGLLAVAALVPLLAYPGWVRLVASEAAAESLGHPFLQLAQETAAMVGELDGLRAGYRRVPSRHLIDA